MLNKTINAIVSFVKANKTVMVPALCITAATAALFLVYCAYYATVYGFVGFVQWYGIDSVVFKAFYFGVILAGFSTSFTHHFFSSKKWYNEKVTKAVAMLSSVVFCIVAYPGLLAWFVPTVSVFMMTMITVVSVSVGVIISMRCWNLATVPVNFK